MKRSLTNYFNHTIAAIWVFLMVGLFSATAYAAGPIPLSSHINPNLFSAQNDPTKQAPEEASCPSLEREMQAHLKLTHAMNQYAFDPTDPVSKSLVQMTLDEYKSILSKRARYCNLPCPTPGEISVVKKELDDAMKAIEGIDNPDFLDEVKVDLAAHNYKLILGRNSRCSSYCPTPDDRAVAMAELGQVMWWYFDKPNFLNKAIVDIVSDQYQNLIDQQTRVCPLECPSAAEKEEAKTQLDEAAKEYGHDPKNFLKEIALRISSNWYKNILQREQKFCSRR